MHNNDRIIRAITRDKSVRILLADTTNLVEEARERHGTRPQGTAALGRVLTAAVMMSTDLKSDQSVTVRINGGGPLGTILAVGRSDGTVRGYVSEPYEDVPPKYAGKIDVGRAVGINGLLEVTKDLGLRAPFAGSVPLVSGEIAEDFAYYFTVSEQIPSLVMLGVFVERDQTVSTAGGLIVQAMPGADDTLLADIEEQIVQLGPITGLLQQERRLETLLAQIMVGIPYDIIGEMPLAFRCMCNEHKTRSIVASMSQEDVNETLEDQNQIEITCNFCNEVYRYSPAEVAVIRTQQQPPPNPLQMN